MNTLTLANPSDAFRFVCGPVYVRGSRRRWYVRLWRFIKRGFKKEPVFTVTSVDYRKGIVTIGS